MNKRKNIIVYILILGLMGCISCSQSNITEDTFLYPAEFEEHESIWLAWPTYQYEPGYSNQEVVLRIIECLAPYVLVDLMVRDKAEIAKANDIFEAKNEWSNWSYWIREAANDPDELEALLDRVERRLEDLTGFILPDNWQEEKDRLTSLGENVPLYRGQRGPVTFAMSVYGVENLIYLIMDNPDLAGRFRDLICRAILERAAVLDREAGYANGDAPRGWSWADDNCAMLNAEMYEFFGAPILDAVFSRYSPDRDDRRGQHSDSAMGHLLPILGRFHLHWVNFGPSLSVTEIRNHMPNTVIQGQLAPFTFSRNETANIVAETLRDFEMSREKKGVVFSTAGSINNGSRLSGLRLIMYVIQRYCRY